MTASKNPVALSSVRFSFTFTGEKTINALSCSEILPGKHMRAKAKMQQTEELPGVNSKENAPSRR